MHARQRRGYRHPVNFRPASEWLEPKIVLSASSIVWAGTDWAREGIVTPELAQGPVYVTPPEPTAEQLAQWQAGQAQRGIMPVPGEGVLEGAATVSEVAATEPAVAPPQGGPARLDPGDFDYYRRDDNDPPGSSQSSTNEPSVATMNEYVFTTSNWTASVSDDNGETFQHISPYTTFASDWGGFCCDQRAAHDANRDLVVWYLQYNRTGSTASDTNGIKIAVANSESDLANNSWVSYSLTPASFGLAAGKWMDFPHMQVTDDFAYFTTNVFRTTDNAYTESIFWRMSLDQLDAGGTVNFSYITRTDGTMGLVTNASDTMYAATIETSTSIRVFTWADSGGSINNSIVSGLSTTNFGTHTSIDVNGNNWTGFADSRPQTGWVAGNEVGFMWNSAQGTNRPNPFVRAVILNRSNFSIISQPDIWASSTTWHYPAMAANARGHLGGTLGYSVGASAVGTQVLLRDDFTSGAWQAFFGVLGSDGPGRSRWGDYLAAQPDDNFPNTWIGQGFSHTGSQTTPTFFWFGRERDNPGPNLRGYDFNVVNEPLLAGEMFDVQFGVINAGAATAAASRVDFYISTNTIISTFDRLLGSYQLNSLSRGAQSGERTVSLALPAAGDAFWVGDQTYYIGMISDAGAAVAEYDESDNSSEGEFLDYDGVSISIVPDDHGNTAGSATLIGSDSLTAGAILPAADPDWFRFYAESGARVLLETNLGTLHDSYLRLYDTDGTTLITFNDDGGAGLASLIDWTFAATGQYYVEVTSYNSASTGSYSLSLTHDDDHGDNAWTATPLSVGVPQTGIVEVNFDGDYFAFSAVAGHNYVIETTLGTLPDSFLYLYDTDGTTLITFDDDGGPGLASRIDWSAPASGTYYVNAAAFSIRVGGYALSITDTTSIDGDFNDDGRYDCADIDALVAAIAAGSHPMAYDLTMDGLVNLLDQDAWLTEAGAANLGPGRAYHLGDANLDGVVDVSDFNTWNANKFSPLPVVPGWCQANFNGDGVVDVSDFNIWNANKFLVSANLASRSTAFTPIPVALTPLAPSAQPVDEEEKAVRDAVFALDYESLSSASRRETPESLADSMWARPKSLR